MDEESKGAPAHPTALGGKYALEQLLGDGGSGVVFAARGPKPESYLVAEPASYIVMDLAPGIDLGRLSRERGPLPIEEAVAYVLEPCALMAEAHRIGLIHGDLAPGSLLLSRRADGSPLVKVVDFGLSRMVRVDPGRRLKPPSTMPLPPSTMPLRRSPEQLRGATVDRATDLWSLGLLLQELLWGSFPFEATTDFDRVRIMLTEPPRPLRERRPDAPAALEAVVEACLERDPRRRIQDVAELAERLLPFAPRGTAPH